MHQYWKVHLLFCVIGIAEHFLSIFLFYPHTQLTNSLSFLSHSLSLSVSALDQGNFHDARSVDL